MEENNNNMSMTNTQTEPETLTNTAYTPAFLKRYIGRLVRIEFLIGTTYLEDRTGVQDKNLLYCDIYSIKFVTISDNTTTYNSGIPAMWGNY